MRNKENIKSGIYCIENIINHKKYIGQSKNIFDRWSKHKSELNRGCHDNDYLQKSWNKYGKDNFSFYILEECVKELLDERERYYIDTLNTTDCNNGYNLKLGGQYNAKPTEFAISKLKESLKKYYSNPENRKRQSDNAYKQWSNPEIKSKIMGENNGMFGKTHSEEARKKISDGQKGRISPYRNLTPVYCIELETTYECAVEAQKKLNINTSILEVCKGNRKTAGGYHWKFALENNI